MHAMIEHPNELITSANGQMNDVELESRRLREDIVLKAMSLLDSPYKWNSMEPYKGSHCAMLGITPFKMVGLIDDTVQLPIEHRDFMLGKNVDKQAFRKFILQFGEEVPFDSRQSADLVTFIYNDMESHVGIITQTDPDWFIHNPSGGAVRFQRLHPVGTLKSVYRHKTILELERNGN